MKRYLQTAVAFAAMLAFSGCAPVDEDSADPTGDNSVEDISRARRDGFDRMMAAARANGSVRVIVGMRMRFTPEGDLDEAGLAGQHATHRALHDAVMRGMRGTTYRMMRDYETVPFMAMEVAPDALAALGRMGEVGSIVADGVNAPTLADSTRLIEATEAQTLGRSGSGQTIAILDTGVDKVHPFLTGKVVEEACYSQGGCPNGTDTQLGAGAGVPCTFHTSCSHGTHVAGIAAGGTTSDMVAYSGVAPGASIMAVRVFSHVLGSTSCNGASDCILAYDSDIIAGLERVYARRTARRIAAVNMSLGGGGYIDFCNDVNPAMTDIIANLRTANIATVIAAGNDGYTNGVSFPGCISHAITVGATTKTDTVATFSNSSALVDLLAPGVSITSSIPGGGYAAFNGTSMAAPHVAGAIAVLRAHETTAPVGISTLLSYFTARGQPVTDARNSVVRPRIRVLSSLVALGDTGLQGSYNARYYGAGVSSNGIGLATRRGGPSSGTFTISDIPSNATTRAAFFYWMSVGAARETAVFRNFRVTGALVGAARSTTSAYNQGPIRVYRADVTLLVASTGANGSYFAGGITPLGGDSQGASLVIVWSDPSVLNIGQVVINSGARSVLDGETASITFTGLNVPVTVGSATLNLGVGDGESGQTEGALRLNGATVTPTNFLSGTDGLAWDDQRWSVSGALIPVGSTAAIMSLNSVSDSVVLAFAALRQRP